MGIDGPLCAGPHEVAASVADRLRAVGRPATHVFAEHFWRDASLRLEFGHTDVESYLTGWLDVGALQRELLDPLAVDGTGEILTSLRDPVTNRATREPRRRSPPGTVLLLSGELLLGQGLPLDYAIHLDVSASARSRRTTPELAWTLAAHEEYESRVAPATIADVVVRFDDPNHPAISGAAHR